MTRTWHTRAHRRRLPSGSRPYAEAGPTWLVRTTIGDDWYAQWKLIAQAARCSTETSEHRCARVTLPNARSQRG
jgi:hypothetical protein